MYHVRLLDTIKNQLWQKFKAANESMKVFLSSSRNFSDLKDRIELLCQEESPNWDAELIIDAATVTTAKHQPQWTAKTADKTASGA